MEGCRRKGEERGTKKRIESVKAERKRGERRSKDKGETSQPLEVR